MAKYIKKLVIKGVEYLIPEGGGGGDLDVTAVDALIDAKLGNFDSLFKLNSGLYKVINWLSDEDDVGLTSGENRDQITSDASSMSIISHSYTVMVNVVNSSYAMEVICSKDQATKEVSECWNSISVIAESERARNIYLSSEYGNYYLNNYQVVQDAFSGVVNSLYGIQLVPFLCNQTFYTQIMSNQDQVNSLKTLTLNDFMPVYEAYADIWDYADFDALKSNATDFAKVLNNSNCLNVMVLASDFLTLINDATAMGVIASNSTIMATFYADPAILNWIVKSSVAISAITADSTSNAILQNNAYTIYNTVTGSSTYFTQKTRTYADGVSSLNSSCTTANCIVMAALGYYSSTSQYSKMTHANWVVAANRNNVYRPTSVSASNCNGISFTNCTFTETNDGYAAIAVYQAI